jgi:hypothetical protein
MAFLGDSAEDATVTAITPMQPLVRIPADACQAGLRALSAKVSCDAS